MKPQRPLIVLIIALFVFFMLGGLSSLADRNRPELKKGGGPSASQPTYLLASPTPGKRSDNEVKEVENRQARQDEEGEEDENDPDMPAKFHGKIDKETYLRMRDEYVGLKRGFEAGRPFDPMARGRAIERMEDQQRQLESASKSSVFDRLAAFLGVEPTVGPVWTPLGPAPLPNGGGTIPVSGRVTTVVVDPTNPNIVYVGAAQGGVWRSLDGGATWTAIFDSAQSLAIGALALAPSDHTILYVGTGEFNGCGDCFFGAGLYRIDNADTSATLVGPINPSQTISNLTYNIFTGRSISKILVHPTDPATVFVATARGVGGSGANSLSNQFPPLATRGVYRSTNATAALASSITFQKLIVNGSDNCFDSPCTGNNDISDMVMEPGSPNNILVGLIGITGSSSGVYRTTNALTTASFTQVLALPLLNGLGIRVELAINKVGSTVTAYAATSETPTATPGCTGPGSGAIHKQMDPFNSSSTWSTQLLGGGGFCAGQCFYDMPIAVDPVDPNLVYIGGQTSGTCGRLVGKSTDGGASFAADGIGLHADDHSLFFDGAGKIYTGNDGGVWKRSATAAVGTAWTNLNNAPLNTLQFEGIAVHPSDRNLMIGGTQDNGTEYQQTSGGNWHGAEGGDGGYALIDQSATNTVNVNMYHTFYNCNPISCPSGAQIGFDRAVNTTCLPNFDFWPTRGAFGGSNILTTTCDGTALYIQNGISINDNVLFYAPMALGPGSPNTVYFGTDRLYRSTDRGDSMAVVSQPPIVSTGCGATLTLPCPISTIAISPQDDNYRIVGLQNGRVWATSIGSSTLVDITSGVFPANPNGSTANKFVGRAMIDPTNKNVAYVAFSFFAPAGTGVWKITNLGAAAGASPSAAIWVAAGNGIPSIPINAFAIDPANSNNLFAGTDIGVYSSTDGGANWVPYGTGLPRVAVFDMKLQDANRVLRIGTHGRGVWEALIGGTPAPSPSPTPTSSPTPTPSPSPSPSPSGNGVLYASSDFPGKLYTINVNTGAGTLVGNLPAAPDGITEIEFDNTTHRAFAQFAASDFMGQEFDINTGAGIGAPIPNGGAFNGLEWVGSTLYGTRITAGGGPSELRTLNPFTGTSTPIGATGGGPIAGLAYDSTSGIMYGLTGGAFGGSSNLVTVNLTTGAATTVGSVGFNGGSLEFGPDGNLYAGSTGNTGNLYRINKATGASTLVGPTGFNNVTGLTLVTSAVNTIQFSSASYTVSETGPRVDITLTRSGNTTSSASVNFATNDAAGLTNCNVFNGTASPRCDYENTIGTATWAAGDATSKSFSIAIVDDSYAEGTESFTVGLNTPSGATLGAQSTATVTITDNEGSNGPNPIDQTNFFVRQQYLDFLGREPDPFGFAGWTSSINNCAPGDTSCDRIHVSQLFFESAEFQQRGYFVYRFYPVAFGRKPDYSEFVPDLARVSGFLDAAQLEAAKVQFIADFMARPAFVSAYSFPNTPTGNQQYVDALLNTAGVTLLPSPATHDALIAGLNNATTTRAIVLRQIVESVEVSNKYNHQAYAVMEYFGYLRRQPDAFYLDWIVVLDTTNNPRGMVTGFVTSLEYRNRFGP